ncbi:MAG: hypothetical protein GXP23_07075 [Gammaproteobacteria bacterium]|nr:hypothetical protein [Gammaproteobacteria bacterium]
MTDKKNMTAENRRNLLKTIAAGSGAIITGKALPDSWARPVIDSVLLPVHAQTSGGPYGGTSNNPITMNDSDGLFPRILNKLVPEGYAQAVSYDFTYCITPVSDTKANTAVLVTPGGSCPYFAQLFTLHGVEINTGPQDMGGYQNECLDTSATDWLDSIGLIKDAMASISSTIELTNIQGQVTGTFHYDSGYIVDDFVLTGSCSSMTVTCCEGPPP